MSKKILFLLSLFVYACIYTSCDDDIPVEDQVNEITWEILASSSVEVLSVSANRETYHATSGWKYSYKTKNRNVECTASCDDSDVLITIKAYVNGKLKKEESGRGSAKIRFDVKPPSSLIL